MLRFVRRWQTTTRVYFKKVRHAATSQLENLLYLGAELSWPDGVNLSILVWLYLLKPAISLPTRRVSLSCKHENAKE